MQGYPNTTTNPHNIESAYHLYCNSQGKRKLAANFTLGEYDVLCARGKKAHNAPGNIRFRDLVATFAEAYAAATCKYEKSKIVTHIVNTVRNSSPSGGFVKQLTEAGVQNWYEVGDRAAKEKVGQTFRDLLHTKYSSSTKAKARARVQKRVHEENMSSLDENEHEDDDDDEDDLDDFDDTPIQTSLTEKTNLPKTIQVPSSSSNNFNKHNPFAPALTSLQSRMSQLKMPQINITIPATLNFSNNNNNKSPTTNNIPSPMTSTSSGTNVFDSLGRKLNPLSNSAVSDAFRSSIQTIEDASDVFGASALKRSTNNHRRPSLAMSSSVISSGSYGMDLSMMDPLPFQQRSLASSAAGEPLPFPSFQESTTRPPMFELDLHDHQMDHVYNEYQHQDNPNHMRNSIVMNSINSADLDSAFFNDLQDMMEE